jgi:hypothetical protein
LGLLSAFSLHHHETDIAPNWIRQWICSQATFHFHLDGTLFLPVDLQKSIDIQVLAEQSVAQVGDRANAAQLSLRPYGIEINADSATIRPVSLPTRLRFEKRAILFHVDSLLS